jgi:dTDP-4-amino-4,6-dideoxygalactose transaminase
MQKNKRVYLSPPQLSGREFDYVKEALESNWVAPAGPFLTRFEDALAQHAGVNHVLATNSGTSAIHLALLVLGVSKGDEVLCSSLTFIGSSNPIVYCGASPVFVDSEEQTWNMDPDLLAEAIEDRVKATGKLPKAIVVVHLYGMPAQMDRIMVIARQYGIPVVEDAAEAVGSVFQGRQAGALADIGVYSFNGNKIITTSGGGALLTNNPHWMAKARYLANQAKENLQHFEHYEVGYNYMLSNISAAIGLAQLEELSARVAERRRVYRLYKQFFSNYSFQNEPQDVFSNYWLTVCLTEDEGAVETIQRVAADENVELRRFWKPLHLQGVYRSSKSYLNGVSDRLFQTGICLPFCSEEVIENLAEKLRKG